MLKNKLVLADVLALFKEGKNSTQISKELKISRQTFQWYVDKLKNLGCIEKIGYGVWNVVKDVPVVPRGSIKGDSDNSPKEIRGHAFVWKIEFVNPYDWKKAMRDYRKKKLTFSWVCQGKVPRTILNNRKMWLTRKGLTIYEPLDFMGRSSFQVKGTAVFEMDKLIKEFLREMGLKFKYYRFSTSREHYGMVKNELARQYNRRKEKMVIRSEDGTSWLWIDDSKGLGELETGEPNISRQVQNYWNDLKKSGFKTNATYIEENFKESAKQIQQNTKNLDYHAENMRSHVQAVKDLSAGVKKQNKLFERIAKALEERKL